VILLVAMSILKPVEFSVFPAALLLMTLFRLSLNVSSARLILLNGNGGTSAAGHVIEAFGTFVVGGNYIVGVVIFLVLIAIQYVVINHGAVRISEVTARFTLDAMPGKQMSIDSDLNAGLIDEAEARMRRRQLAAEAEFYGAMDGASRFTQRDAVASILITAINIIAGFLIGVLQHGMDLMRAISGGLVVTRASAEARLGTEFRRQVFGKSQPLLMASGVLFILSLFPGLPMIPFLLFGGGLGTLGWRMRKTAAAEEKTTAAAAPSAARENLEALLKVEPLAVEVGLGLVRLVEGGAQSPLLKKIAAIRRQLATDLGYLLPPVRVTDNLSLRSREYVLLLKGSEVARHELPQGCDLAINAGKAAAPIEGMATREPAFGIPAVWIRPEQAEAARKAGYTVVDATSVLGTHLAEIIRRYAHEIFTRQDAKRLLDRVTEDHPKVVEDVVPKLIPLAYVERVLQNLLRERASIRDAVSILEALGEAANMTKNQILLTEYVRQAIRRMVVKPYLNASGDLAAYLVDPALEQVVERAIEHGEHTSHLNLAPQAIRDVLERIQRVTGVPESPVAAVAGPGTRYFLRQLVEPTLYNVFFISHNEIPPGVKVVSMGVIR
jgi:flagellar biosynthesis protein FlhA